MQKLSLAGFILAIFFGCGASLNAQDTPLFSDGSSLQRDATYEQYLHFQSSPDTAMTPARFMRWVKSLVGGRTTVNLTSSSKLEFQPIVRANETQKQFIAQIAYKF